MKPDALPVESMIRGEIDMSLNAPWKVGGEWPDVLAVYDARAICVAVARVGHNDDGTMCPPHREEARTHARLIAAAPTLRDVVEALILFYDSPRWTPEKAARWEELTGSTEATTKVLADSARVALGMVVNP